MVIVRPKMSLPFSNWVVSFTWKTGLNKVHDWTHVRNGPDRILYIDGVARFGGPRSVANGSAATGISMRQRWMAGYVVDGWLLTRWLERSAHFGDQRVALAEFIFQVLRRAQTLELAIHHDGDTRAQRLTFFHTETFKTHDDSLICCRPQQAFLYLSIHLLCTFFQNVLIFSSQHQRVRNILQEIGFHLFQSSESERIEMNTCVMSGQSLGRYLEPSRWCPTAGAGQRDPFRWLVRPEKRWEDHPPTPRLCSISACCLHCISVTEKKRKEKKREGKKRK